MSSKKIHHYFIILIFSTKLSAQRNYYFGSTGQQKLLINPALCASTEGLHIQGLGSVNSIFGDFPYGGNYLGVSYGSKKLSGGISDTYFSRSSRYSCNQTDASLAYRINIGKVAIVPSIQASYFGLKRDLYVNYPTNTITKNIPLPFI